MFQGKIVDPIHLPEEVTAKIAEIDAMYASKLAEMEAMDQKIKTGESKLNQINSDIEFAEKDLQISQTLIDDNEDTIKNQKVELVKSGNQLSAVKSEIITEKENLRIIKVEIEKFGLDRETYRKQSTVEKEKLEIITNDLDAKIKESEIIAGKLEKIKNEVEASSKKIQETEVSVVALENRKIELEAKIKELEETFATNKSFTEKESSELNADLNAIRNEYTVLSNELSGVQSLLATAKTELENTQKQRREELADLEDQKNAFAVYVREAKIKYPNIKI